MTPDVLKMEYGVLNIQVFDVAPFTTFDLFVPHVPLETTRWVLWEIGFM